MQLRRLLDGEQFYRAGFDYPDEPPDPETAVFGPEGNRGGVEAELEPGDDRSRGRRLLDSLKEPSITVLRWTGATALELAAVWLVLYLTLVALSAFTPLPLPEGSWKWLAAAVLVCAALIALKQRRHVRFRAGELIPGKKK